MNLYNLVSFLGIWILLGVAFGLSKNRRRVAWRTVAAGVTLQLIFGLIVFLVPWGTKLFMLGSRAVLKILQASMAGTRFCFGPLSLTPGEEGSLGFILVFQALPTIVFFTALMELLYFLGIMTRVLKLFARLFTWLMRISGAEALFSASSIFVGIESATTIRPYLANMTRSELCMILTAGMATIASSVLGLYVMMLHSTFPHIAAHLISASILSAPAAIVVSKLLLPETDQPETLGMHIEPHYDKERNILEAVLQGAMAGGKLVMGVIVVLLAFLGLTALINIGLDVTARLITAHTPWTVSLSLPGLLAYVFYPFTLVIGVPSDDAMLVAQLLGERIVMTEVPAYQHLAQYIAQGAFHHPRSAVLAAYALCGFTHIASLAIFIGGISALAPEKTRVLTQVAWRALVAATIAGLMTAAIAGTFYGRGILLLTK